MFSGFSFSERLLNLAKKEVFDAAKETYFEFINTKPKDRILSLAGEIVELKPDFIALQEVSEFKIKGGALFNFNLDFLTELRNTLNESSSCKYEAISSDDFVLSYKFGGKYLSGEVIFRDRETILYKKGFSLDGDIVKLKLKDHREPLNYIGDKIIFNRSLLGGKFKSEYGESFGLFSTHLDQAMLNSIQPKQGKEIIQFLINNYGKTEDLFLLGDFNADENGGTYKLITEGGFKDSYREINPVDGLIVGHTHSESKRRIDYIFYLSKKWKVLKSEVVLNKADPKSQIFPSDHFGLFTVFERI